MTDDRRLLSEKPLGERTGGLSFVEIELWG